VDEKLGIRKLLQDLLKTKGDRLDFSDSDLLITSGRLQSIDTLEVVVFLEEKYGIDFAEHGFDQNELDSVDRIMTLINTK
jgi:acyl carrier protein